MELLKLKLFQILLLGTLLTGCQRYIVNKPYFNYHINYPSTEIDRFRLDVCFRILNEAYKGTNAFKEIEKKDDLNYLTDVVYSKSYYHAIDSIANDFLNNVPNIRSSRAQTSSDSTKDFKEGNETKDHFLIFVLNFYESRELDSLARHYMQISDKEYKKAVNDSYRRHLKYLKEENKDIR